MLVKESLPNDLPRINRDEMVEPVKFWALYATSFYERLLGLADNKKQLKKAYNKKIKEIKSDYEATEALNFFYRIRREELDERNIWESLLLESPDGIEARNLSEVIPGTNTLDLTDFQIPFGYYDGKMRVGKLNGIHPSIKELYDDIERSVHSRLDLKYPGRLWIQDKVVSFWEYPKTKTELLKILSDVENEFFRMAKRPFTLNPNDWFIEIVDKRLAGDNFPEVFGEWADAEDAILVPVKDYSGSDEWSEETKGKEHVQSPVDKGPKKVPPGVGSRKYGSSKPLPLRQAMYTSENLVPSFREFLEL